MRIPSVLALLAAAEAALDGLGPCQSRCYDMAADLIGCEAADYACHCASFNRLSAQLSSCMIEGCAFGDEGPTMGALLFFSFPRLRFSGPG
ncbi:hypothetical protein IMZ48_03710 [Candidatus Bathyarchaeota archaeon]|nr:hypothetical protein [Candidatus Bathyarchaeota archaeon]